MKNIRSYALLVVAALLVATAAGAASKPITLQLKLPAKPAFPRPEMAALLTAGPVSVVVVDARGGDDPAVVGAQRAKGKDIYLWRAAQPVAPAVTGLVTQLLRGWSVQVAPESEFWLRFSLTTYFVNERSDTFGSTYVADVRFDVALVDRAGVVLSMAEARGDGRRPGVDGRVAMCNEALSIALRAALAQGLSSVKLESAAPAVPVAALHTVIEPAALLADLSRLKAGGMADDVLVGYVEQRKLSRPLTVDEILEWKNAGIPDAAIKAATK